MVERWIVAPKAVGSNPAIYPILKFLNILFKRYNVFFYNIKQINTDLNLSFLYKTMFIDRYYLFNDFIWQEALLIDFLQKKVINKWTQKFLVVSSYLFNERLVFDTIINFVLENFIWPLHKLFIFEFNNVANLLTFILFMFILIIFLLYFIYFVMFLF